MTRAVLLRVLVLATYACAKCPDGAITSVVDAKLCYKFVPDATAWMDAEMQCNQANGHLTSILDGFSNVFLNDKAQQAFTAFDAFFIGANDIRTRGLWGWEDGSSLKYQNWALGEPTNRTGFDCGAVSLKDGAWRAASCYQKLPYVCLLPPVSSACPPPPPCSAPHHVYYCDDGWAIFQSHCYKVGPGINQTFWDARTGCQEMGADLASIHSEKEKEFIKGRPFSNRTAAALSPGLGRYGFTTSLAASGSGPTGLPAHSVTGRQENQITTPGGIS